MSSAAATIGLVLLLLGPMPWSISLAAAQPPGPGQAIARILALIVVWCALQAGLAVGMGAVGVFDSRALVGTETALFVFGLVTLFARPRPVMRLPRRDSLTWAEQMVVLAIVTVGVGLTIRSIATPITDEDSLAYHLPVMAKWYQTHAFGMLEQFYERRFQISRYPYCWEALSALFLVPLREDFLVAIPQIMAWGVFGLGIALIAITLGAQRSASLVFAFLALTTPIVRAHVMTMHVDLALGAFFVAGVAFAVRAPRDRFSVVALFACIGLVAGIKTSGLVYAAFLVATFCCARVMRPRDARDGRVAGSRGPPAGTGVVLAVVLAAGFWYARNLVETGNPLGFARVTVAGRTLFDGPLDTDTVLATTLWRQFRFDDARDWRILVGQMHKQLGLPFLVSMLAACAVSAPRPRTWRVHERREGLLFAGLVTATGLAYWVTPVTANNWDGGPITPWIGQAFRYAFPFIGLVSASGAVLLGGGRTVYLLLPVAVIAGLVDSSTRFMWIGAVLLLFGSALHAASARYGSAGRLVSVCAMAAVLGVLIARLHGTRDAARIQLYRGLPAFIDREVGPDDVVGYLLSHESYLLYGTHFTRTVAYVPAGADERTAWIEHLRARRVTFLAVGPIRPEWRRRKELAWIHGTVTFVRVFGRDETTEPVVYRVNGD